MTMYAIATWFPIERRQRACQMAYDHPTSSAPRTSEKRLCPFSIVLGVDELVTQTQVARAAMRLAQDEAADHDTMLNDRRRFIRERHQEAAIFMRDWDARRIPSDQLPIALGVHDG